MSEMISNIPALGILFDVDKIESGDYGTESWKIFWRAIKGEQFYAMISMFDGDLMENFNIYCIGIQTFDQKVLDRIKKIMEEDIEYKKVSANPNFIEGYNVIKEPLPGSGVIKVNGNFIPKGQACPAEVAYDELEAGMLVSDNCGNKIDNTLANENKLIAEEKKIDFIIKWEHQSALFGKIKIFIDGSKQATRIRNGESIKFPMSKGKHNVVIKKSLDLLGLSLIWVLAKDFDISILNNTTITFKFNRLNGNIEIDFNGATHS